MVDVQVPRIFQKRLLVAGGNFISFFFSTQSPADRLARHKGNDICKTPNVIGRASFKVLGQFIACAIARTRTLLCCPIPHNKCSTYLLPFSSFMSLSISSTSSNVYIYLISFKIFRKFIVYSFILFVCVAKFAVFSLYCGGERKVGKMFSIENVKYVWRKKGLEVFNGGN